MADDKTKKQKLFNPKEKEQTLNLLGAVANMTGQAIFGKQFAPDLGQPFKMAAANEKEKQMRESVLGAFMEDPALSQLVQEGNSLADQGGILGNLNQNIPNADFLAQLAMGGNLGPAQAALTKFGQQTPNELALQQANIGNIQSQTNLRDIDAQTRNAQNVANLEDTFAQTQQRIAGTGLTTAQTVQTGATTEHTKTQTSLLKPAFDLKVQEFEAKADERAIKTKQGLVDIEKTITERDKLLLEMDKLEKQPSFAEKEAIRARYAKQLKGYDNNIKEQQAITGAARQKMGKQTKSIDAINRQGIILSRLQGAIDSGKTGLALAALNASGSKGQFIAQQLGIGRDEIQVIKDLRELTSEKVLEKSGAAATDLERAYIESQNPQAWESTEVFQDNVHKVQQQIGLAKVINAVNFANRGVGSTELGDYGIRDEEDLRAAAYIKKVMNEKSGMLNGTEKPTQLLLQSMQRLNIPFIGAK